MLTGNFGVQERVQSVKEKIISFFSAGEVFLSALEKYHLLSQEKELKNRSAAA